MSANETDKRPRLVGINHVALEVGDIEQALAFYGRFFDFTLRGRAPGMAFIDLGDQFLALSEGRSQPRDDDRHFGIVVDDREGLRQRLEAAGVELVSEKRLDFLDPWGNRIEVVSYADIQMIKAREVLRAMDLAGLRKSDAARRELEDKGIKASADA